MKRVAAANPPAARWTAIGESPDHELILRVHPYDLPVSRVPAGPVTALQSFRHDPGQPVLTRRIEERDAIAFDIIRYGDQPLRPHHLAQHPLARAQRLVHHRPPVSVKDVERLERDGLRGRQDLGLTRVCRYPGLERREIRPPVLRQRDDLSVEHMLRSVEIIRQRPQFRILAADVASVTVLYPDLPAID